LTEKWLTMTDDDDEKLTPSYIYIVYDWHDKNTHTHTYTTHTYMTNDNDKLQLLLQHMYKKNWWNSFWTNLKWLQSYSNKQYIAIYSFINHQSLSLTLSYMTE